MIGRIATLLSRPRRGRRRRPRGHRPPSGPPPRRCARRSNAHASDVPVVSCPASNKVSRWSRTHRSGAAHRCSSVAPRRRAERMSVASTWLVPALFDELRQWLRRFHDVAPRSARHSGERGGLAQGGARIRSEAAEFEERRNGAEQFVELTAIVDPEDGAQNDFERQLLHCTEHRDGPRDTASRPAPPACIARWCARAPQTSRRETIARRCAVRGGAPRRREPGRIRPEEHAEHVTACFPGAEVVGLEGENFPIPSASAYSTTPAAHPRQPQGKGRPITACAPGAGTRSETQAPGHGLDHHWEPRAGR